MRQMFFNFKKKESDEIKDYVLFAGNRIAYQAIEYPKKISGNVLFIVGPDCSGKTHLCKIFKKLHHAKILSEKDINKFKPENISGFGYYIIEDLNRKNIKDNDLFHLFNWVNENNLKILITSKIPPEKLDIKLADLKSRVNSYDSIKIDNPNVEFSKKLISKLFSDKERRVPKAVIEYLAKTIERDYKKIVNAVNLLNNESMSQGKKISLNMARDLFEEKEK